MLQPDARTLDGALATAVQPPPRPTGADRTLVLSLGVALIGGLIVLMVVLSLRLIRRVAEGTPIVAARTKKRPMRGAGRDPWREAARRMVVPPPESNPTEDEGDGEPKR